MSQSLRRSRRSRKPSAYSVGDVVEISRNGGSSNGRLVYSLTEGVSPNPRWLVTFDDERRKDEEVYERSFGRLVKSGEGAGESSLKVTQSSAVSSRRGRNIGRRSAKDDSRRNSGATSSSDSDEISRDKKTKVSSGESNGNGKKSVSFSAASQAASDDSLSPSNAAKKNLVSAREQRSLRRQAQIDVGTPTTMMAGAKRKRSTPVKTNGGANGTKRTKPDPSEEVIKVQMLTGTLYLYRGLNRRAEFIRRY